jgi:hypothetical protein
MTAQISDDFFYNSKLFDLAGFSEDDPFCLQELELSPKMATTACWRGYKATYGLDSCNNLILKDLFINLYNVDGEKWEDIRGKLINGIAPCKPKDDYFAFNNIYKNINLPMCYRGGILIADGFLHEYYVHMGFHPAWKYKEAYELVFNEGHCELANDVSDKMEYFRSNVLRTSDKIIESWIANRFVSRYPPLDTWVNKWNEILQTQLQKKEQEQCEKDNELKTYNLMLKELFEDIKKNGQRCSNCGANSKEYRLSEGLKENQIYTSKSLIICRKCGHVVEK